MKISIGATGGLIVGDVLDVNIKHLQSKLQDYDPQLYLKWNSKKNRGFGKWELRRRPEKKSIVKGLPYQGDTLCVIDYVENDLEHHVWDVDVADYRLLEKIKQCDVWAMSNYTVGQTHRFTNFFNKMDDVAYNVKESQKDKLRADMLYNLKQDKAVLADFKEKITSGVNPAHLMRYWGRTPK